MIMDVQNQGLPRLSSIARTQRTESEVQDARFGGEPTFSGSLPLFIGTHPRQLWSRALSSSLVHCCRHKTPPALAGVILIGITPQGFNLFMSNPETSNPNLSDPNASNPAAPESTPASEPAESFKDIFSEYEHSHSRKKEPGAQGREGTVIAVTADSIVLDIGFKTEGVLPLTAFPADKPPKPGDKVQVTIKGRDPEGYYELTRGKVEHPTDWASLEKAFAEKSTIVGTVTGVVKGGLSVDIGVRAFMPASRSGTKDASELEKLVEQEIRCRIIKLDVDEEDVVVDRRVLAEDEERAGKERRFSELKEGDTVQGEVRSLTDYGAFVDIGGADALLHVGEISWRRINKPSDVLSAGQRIEAVIIKIDADKHRIAISMKQLQPHPWDAVAEKYKAGERVRGTVTRLMPTSARLWNSSPASKA